MAFCPVLHNHCTQGEQKDMKKIREIKDPMSNPRTREIRVTS
jgi:hypothetical protein